MFLLSYIFVIVCGLFEWKQIYAGYLSFVYICIALEIQLSIRREDWVHISRFNSATCLCLCLPQARTLISNVLCCGLLFCSDNGSEVIARFVDIGGIVENLFIIYF